MRPLKVYPGAVFGDWTVLSREGRKVWCRCACGVEKDVEASNLTAGVSRRCRTCSSRNAGRIRTDEYGEEWRKSVCYRLAKSGARKRGTPLELSKEAVWKIMMSNCHYCGSEPSNTYKTVSGQQFNYNGIDRLDSSKEYVPDNVLPCCAMCNYMKRDSPYGDFISHVAKISKHTPAGSTVVVVTAIEAIASG